VAFKDDPAVKILDVESSGSPRRPAGLPRKLNTLRLDQEVVKVRLTPEERAELEAMAGTTTLSRFVRGLLREARTSACA
jgi:hypothetical protein